MQHITRGLPGSRQREPPTCKQPMGGDKGRQPDAKGYPQAVVRFDALSTATELRLEG